MKPITLPGIDDYATRHTTKDSEMLALLTRQTRQEFEAWTMISGPQVARLLEALVWALQARTILEIGTFTGYSAISMASVLPENGRLITCEMNPRHAESARENISRSPYGGRVTIEVGPALETIRRLSDTFDLIFIDADKKQYLEYFEATLPKLAPRGLMVADNTLWNGDVLYDFQNDEIVAALRKFNDAVSSDPRVISVLLTVRDGLTLIRRRRVI
jgi:caffeoyl-CoA O-methyltransferase